MKSLVEYILEKSEESLEIRDGIDYEQFADLLMFLDQHDEFNERKQAICDVFRRSYSTNITQVDVKSSPIFKRFIDDVITKYNELVGEDDEVSLNVSTRTHLEDDVASKMLVKISLEQELPKVEEDNI